jgi:exodeoxyribonuclease VII large subunit
MAPDSPNPATDFSRDVFTVSRLNREARCVLEGSFPLLWVEGEISNLSRPASGHLYFSLKDPAAQVRCAMFRSKRLLLRFNPAVGQHVLIRASVSLYESRGEFQLVVEQMEPAGEGALRLELERLKRKLAAEGLFDEALKRPLPPFPQQVGLITSPSGAAIHDLLSVLRRRFPATSVVIYPAQVQGEGAAEELREALELANRRGECDLLILSRGGGSLEDLMAFNDERLARSIRRSRIPVVTGVGHDIDLTIADLVADRRGATPSAAAELVSPSAEHLIHRLRGSEQRLAAAWQRRASMLRQRLGTAVRHLGLLHPLARIRRLQQRGDELERRLIQVLMSHIERQRVFCQGVASRLGAASPRRSLERVRLSSQALQGRLLSLMPREIKARRDRLAGLAQVLETLSPLATLSRGYAIVRRLPDRKILRRAGDVQPGDRLEAGLSEGSVIARVEEVKGGRS